MKCPACGEEMKEVDVYVGPEETYHPETGEISTQPEEESSGTGSAFFCPNKNCPSKKRI